MKVLLVLIVSFALSLAAIKIFTGEWNEILAGNIAMSTMLAFTGIAHFALAKGMSMMIPEAIPFKGAIVAFTGLVELAAAAGLLIPSLRHLTAVLLIIFFILILPANIYAAFKKVDIQKGSSDGPGLAHLWFRIPMQIFLIAWVYYFSLK